ncbi:MAG: hypothetical protein R2725_05170 [Solirubrobacterales bacterium]
MFNPLSAPDVTRAVGAVLKAAAEGGPDDEYRRGQLLSAYSMTRHLAAEEEAQPRLRSWFGAELEAILGPSEAAAWVREAEPAELGERLCELLAELRAAADPGSLRTAAALRALLRELCDREVAALAEAA